jgi:hypothetical protein
MTSIKEILKYAVMQSIKVRSRVGSDINYT